MSAKYATVEKYYKTKMWDLSKVRNAVEKEWITAEEFEMITGQTY